MADDDSPRDANEPATPSLAPPSLGPPGLGVGRLRRRRKSAPAAAGAGGDLAATATGSRGVADETTAVMVPPATASAGTERVDPERTDPAELRGATTAATATDRPPIDFHPPTTGPTVHVGDLPPDADEGATVTRSFRVPGRVAAVLVGLVVGALLVVATAGAGRACDATATGACDGGLGVLLLVAIVVVAVVAGTVLLRVLKVPEAGSTSFLAVGLTVVIALLFFVQQLTQWWMIIVIPVVSVVTYLASHWVTDTYGDATFD